MFGLRSLVKSDRMWSKKVFLQVVLVVVLALSLSACGEQRPEVLRIAVSIPQTEWFEENVRPALEIALEERNGSAEGVPVELLFIDNPEWTLEGEEQAANQAIADPSVVAYIGPQGTDLCQVSMPILNEAGLAQFGLVATWPGLTTPGFGPGEPGIYYPTGRRHFFQLMTTDNEMGALAAIFASELGVGTVYLVEDGIADSTGSAGIFERTAVDLDIEVIGYDTISPEPTDDELAAEVQRIMEADPDLVYFAFASDEANARFLVAARQEDPDLLMMGALLKAPVEDVIPAMGFDQSLANDVYNLYGGIPPMELETESGRAFLESFEARTGNPVSYSFTVTVYEAVGVILEAIDQADELTREGVLESLQNLDAYSGALGTWHFNENGEISLLMGNVTQWNDGEWAVIRVFSEERD